MGTTAGTLIKNRASVTILLSDSDALMRQGLRNALANVGYRNVRPVSRISILREIVAASLPDLLILDVDTPDGDAIALVTEIRHGKLGRNPFLPVIFTAWNSDPAVIARAANSGADLILAKPLSPVQLFSRIDSLVANRKPFIATTGYIGPERREKERRGNTKHFEVPNTLKEKLEGKPIDATALSAAVETVMRDMNESRLESAAVALAAKVEDVCNAYQEGTALDGIDDALTLIVRIAKNIQAMRTGDITDLCGSLVRIAGTMRRTPQDIDAREIELLRPLSQSILLAAGPDLKEPAAMAAISRAVARFAPNIRGAGLAEDLRLVASGA